jgi:ribosomal protein S18 acetylase RimI-like enzyme
MDEFSVRPMAPGEFEAIRSRMIREYAAEHVRAGDWSPDDAEVRAAAQTDELLPQGVNTPDMFILMAVSSKGLEIGHVWVGLKRPYGSGAGAWIYNIEINPDQRGKGYGRALLEAAERETARRGVTTIGLNVFGPNAVARSLYESAGYEVATLQMKKGIASAN